MHPAQFNHLAETVTQTLDHILGLSSLKDRSNLNTALQQLPV
jgi:hypothetical protein